MTETHEAAPLEYAPGARLRRRRRIRRIIALCLGVAMGVAAYHWGPAAWSWTNLLYHQHHCRRYAAPPDQVVFDSDPARVAQLTGDPNYLISGGCAFRKPPRDWLAFSPAVPAGWRTGPTAMIFLHELKAGGVSRLVEVERVVGANESPYFITGYDVETHSILPVRFRKPQVSDQRFTEPLDVEDSIGPHLDIRIYAGQTDPADGSHFTIRCEHGGKTHTADGYLRPDGEIYLNANR